MNRALEEFFKNANDEHLMEKASSPKAEEKLDFESSQMVVELLLES